MNVPEVKSPFLIIGQTGTVSDVWVKLMAKPLGAYLQVEALSSNTLVHVHRKSYTLVCKQIDKCAASGDPSVQLKKGRSHVPTFTLVSCGSVIMCSACFCLQSIKKKL